MAWVKLRCIMGSPGLKDSYREKGLFWNVKNMQHQNKHHSSVTEQWFTLDISSCVYSDFKVIT